MNHADGILGDFVEWVGRTFNDNRENTMTLLPNLIVSTTYVEPESELLAHELGHAQQASSMSVPNYWTTYLRMALEVNFDHKAIHSSATRTPARGCQQSGVGNQHQKAGTSRFWWVRYER